VLQELEKMQLTFKVNGKEHRLSVRPRQTLLGVLRDDLGLTGTKQGATMVLAAPAWSP